ncbi:MAG: hypothetical protein IKH38_02215 [Clostridia bacterium]|nr:hypothetical protein [Clostridia bacterium]
MSEAPVMPEKKGLRKPLKILIALVALALAFGLGWRVMPKVWPGIKTALFGQPKVEEPAKPELYVPAATAVFEDPISETDSLIYYFYKDYCPYCRELEPLTAGLPKAITLPDGRQSAVKLVCLKKNTAEGEVADPEKDPAAVIARYYEEHAIPEERQYVPALVIGDRYLFTRTEVVPQLLEALVAGEGLNTPLLNGAERVSAQ